MDKLTLIIKNERDVSLELKRGSRVISQEDLTIGQDFDNMLITTLDKIAIKNRLDKTRLKVMEIRGKLRDGAVSGMLIQTVKSGLGA
jgi:hypothetical protein